MSSLRTPLILKNKLDRQPSSVKTTSGKYLIVLCLALIYLPLSVAVLPDFQNFLQGHLDLVLRLQLVQAVKIGTGLVNSLFVVQIESCIITFWF